MKDSSLCGRKSLRERGNHSSAEYSFPTETILIADGRGRLSGAADRARCAGLPATTVRPCADCIEEGRYVYAHGLIPPASAATSPASVNQDANYSIAARHYGKGTLLFMDGHAKAADTREVNKCNNLWDGLGQAGPCRVGRTAGFNSNYF